MKIELNKITWDIPERYQNISLIGAGAYGHVCSAEDSRTATKDNGKRSVAIKKLSRPFQSVIYAKRTYRELRMLNYMNHENIIRLLDVFTTSTSLETFNDVYFVTHLMAADLNNIVRTKHLSDEVVKFLVYQILRGLKYVHSAGIIHRDLKPSNIAVNEDWELKILDFGLARATESEMTGYVSTRWYRAPEIMLNWMHYHQSVDMWSVGCIMAEMITGKVLFPSKDHIEHLTRILVLCGTPNEETLNKITNEDAKHYIRSLPEMERKNFSEFFKGSNPLMIDLLEKTLEIDMDKRITAEEALAHSYLSEYSDTDGAEPTSTPYDEAYEGLDLSVEKWKEYVWNEIEQIRLEKK